MLDDPVATVLWGSEMFQRTREGILRTVSGARAVELIDLLAASMRTAYLVGRADERRRPAPMAVPLTTLDGMLPAPCCCTRASGCHCPDCHGGGHSVLAAGAAPLARS